MKNASLFVPEADTKKKVYPIIVETITPEIAREYLATSRINRNISKKTVQEYVDYMKAGEWSVNIGSPISFDKEGHLLNGHHRMNAVIIYGYPVDMGVVRGADKDDFKKIDTGKNRSLSDIFTIAGVKKAPDIATIINRYFALRNGNTMSAYITTRQKGRNGKSYIQKDEYLNEYFSDEEFYDNIRRISQNFYQNGIKLLQRSDIAAIYAYLVKDKHNKEKDVIAFFKELYEGGSDWSCIKLLRKRLSDNFINGRINKLNPTYKIALIAKTWNAYISKKDIRSLRVYDNEKVDFI